MKKEYIYLALAALAVWYFLFYKKAEEQASAPAEEQESATDLNVQNIPSRTVPTVNVENIGSRGTVDAMEMQVFTTPANFKKLA